MNAKILVRVVSWRLRNKPVAWIARKEGLDARDVRTLLRIAGDPRWNDSEITLDKYDQMEYFYQQRVTQSEVVRTLKCDNRTVNRWFPDLALKRGSRGHQEAIQLGVARRDLEHLEDEVAIVKQEVWRPAPGFEETHEVSDRGRVRRKGGLPMTMHFANDRYRVSLTVGAVKKLAPVHRLVCEAFHGPAPEGKNYVRYKDGDTTNPTAYNLEWAALSEFKKKEKS